MWENQMQANGFYIIVWEQVYVIETHSVTEKTHKHTHTYIQLTYMSVRSRQMHTAPSGCTGRNACGGGAEAGGVSDHEAGLTAGKGQTGREWAG